MEKLNKYELRTLINEEANTINKQQKIDEGALDYVENLAVTALGHAGFGDAAAAIKAVGPDAYRVGKSAMELESTLDKIGLSLVDLLREDYEENPEMQQALMTLSNMGPGERGEVKAKMERLGQNLKKLLVSIVSIFPDVAISGTIAFTITNMPIEKFLIEGAGVFADLMEKAENSMIGGAFKGFTEFMSKLANGPASLIMNSPLITFKNIGALANATLNPGTTAFGQLKSSLDDSGVTDMAKSYAKDAATDYFNNFSAVDDLPMAAESRNRKLNNHQGTILNESRMLKLAGIK